ncbi:hypothetical protein MMC25_002059 [Agyrium rufum]|nr:hypothetical protein [Agyrium rufum]
MFATSSSPLSHSYFQSVRSSPLSMRDPNTCTRHPASSPLPQQHAKGTSSSVSSRGQSKFNILRKNKDEERVKRRDAFLGRVKQRSEQQRWHLRGDQIARSDYLGQQKRWEEEQARTMADLPACPDSDDLVEEDKMSQSSQNSQSYYQDILSQEEQLEAIYSSLSGQKGKDAEQERDDDMTTEYGDDDDEYQQLFLDYASEIEAHQTSPSRYNTACTDDRSDQQVPNMDIDMS